MTKYLKAGDSYTITRIATPDPDSYAVIYYGQRFAFPCGKGWFDKERPTVGSRIVFGADGHWHVDHGPYPSGVVAVDMEEAQDEVRQRLADALEPGDPK